MGLDKIVNVDFFSNPLVLVAIGAIVVGYFVFQGVKGGGRRGSGRRYRR